MKIIQAVQGSEEWHAFRLEHFGASEAAAMLGLSKKVKRSELLRAKHTGIAKEFSDWVQANILDNGHRVEAMARPIAEEIIGEELFPATYYDGKLSASTDGLTMTGTIAFEHKQWNAELASSVKAGIIPEEHIPQCQQVMMVTRAGRLLFMVSDGTKDNCEYLWVEPDAKWLKRITQGWAQFAVDMAEYQHVEATPEPVAAPVMSLPSITYRLNGLVLTSNLDEYRVAAEALVERSKKPLETDQDFADQDAMNKSFKEAEERIALVCEQVVAEIKDVDAFTRELSHVGELIRQARLNGEKQVKTRKDSIREEIRRSGVDDYDKHICSLNGRIGKNYLATAYRNVPDPDFAGVMRGKKTITSLREAVNNELVRCKILSSEIADRVQINLNSLRELADGYQTLFKDTATIVLKQNDDLVALIKTRIAEHKKEEADRVERERVKKEADDARAAAAVEVPSAAVVVAASGPALHSAVAPQHDIPRPASSGGSLVTPPAAKMARPSDNHIINTLSIQYSTHERVVIGWLLDMDLAAASQRLTAETLSGSRK
jgi:predicted phage-related endonuclease